MNAVLVPVSSSMYLLSAARVLANWTPPAIVALLVASKVVGLAVLWHLCRRHCPGVGAAGLSADAAILRDLLRFGSWMTVSSAIVPILSQMERLMIPAPLSVGALTFYTVPHEALSRGAILPRSQI